MNQDDINQHMLNSIADTHTDIRGRYVFFLMAASGASIAYLLNRQPTSSFHWQVYLYFATLLLLSISFLFGCLMIHAVLDTMFENANLFKSNSRNKRLEFEKKMNRHNLKGVIFSKLQFGSLIMAYLSFLVWIMSDIFKIA